MDLQGAVIDTPESLIVVHPETATSLAPGFRFHPTDEELVRYYLTRKVCGKPIRFDAVSEIDVYRSEPWRLECYSSLKSRDQEWYFFSPVDKKYGNGSRMNRATGQGYWKATGKDRIVCHKSRPIGTKKTLVFHSGRAPDGKRTNWVMHEYKLVDDELEQAGVVQDAFVLCRIFRKSGVGPPNADRYAPFIEEEWDDDTTLFVLGDAEDEKANIDNRNEVDMDRDRTPLLIDQYPFESQGDEYLYKRETSDYVEHQSKKPEEPYSRANCSENSTATSKDPAITTTMTKTKNPPKLFGFSLVESQSPSPPPPAFDTSNHVEKSVPVEYSTFGSGLENEIANVTMESEKMKTEMMSAQWTTSMLYSRINDLTQENEELKKILLRGR